MKQIFLGGGNSTLTNGAVNYFEPFGVNNPQSSAAAATAIVPIDGTASRLALTLDSSFFPNTISLTMYVNGSPTNLSVTATIVSGGITGVDITNEVALTAGDSIYFQTSNGTLSVTLKFSWVFEPTTAQRFFFKMASNTSANFLNSADRYLSVINGTQPGQTTEAAAQSTMPIDFTIKSVHLYSPTAPGVGTSRTATIYKNGSSEASTTVVVSDAEVSDSVTGLSVSVSEGDTISALHSPSGTPAASPIYILVVCEPVVDGESILGTGFGANLSATSTFYYITMASTQTTETIVNTPIGSKIIIDKYYVNLITSPGGSTTRTHYIRKNKASSSLGMVVTGSTTATSDLTNYVIFNSKDLLNFSDVPASSPTASPCSDYFRVRFLNTATIEQHSFRFRDDDGSESGATFLEPLNTDISRAKNTNTRLRLLANVSSKPDDNQYQLEYRKLGQTAWHKVKE